MSVLIKSALSHAGVDRRTLLGASAGAALAVTAASARAQSTPGPQPRKPATPFEQEQLPPFQAETERQNPPPPTPLPRDQRVGFALVGLGRLSIEELLPAFAETERCRPVALVSGDRAKAERLAAQYNVDPNSVYTYDTFDDIADNPAVEVVYVVLPNGLHEEYVTRAAAAGKHVLCEKPMANNSAQAQRMVDACREADRKLMVAYRIQYDLVNRAAKEIVRSGDLGAVKLIESVNTQNQGTPDQWRLDLQLAGGGVLPDIGLYNLNTTRWLLEEEPVEIRATTFSTPGDPRFAEVEESCLWTMRFPSGALATCSANYAAHTSRRYRVHQELGYVDLDPAFAYRELQLSTARAEGSQEVIAQRRVPEKNQFALEMDHFADCVINDTVPYSPGEEGVQDHRLMEAIYEAAARGRPVELPPVERPGAYRGPEPAQS